MKFQENYTCSENGSIVYKRGLLFVVIASENAMLCCLYVEEEDILLPHTLEFINCEFSFRGVTKN